MRSHGHRRAQAPQPERLGSLYRTKICTQMGLGGLARGRVLDIGGFDGYWAATLPFPVVVTDLAPVRAHPSIPYVAGDALRLPFQDGTFDTVYAFDVIEHVPDETALVREAVRVLRPDGVLVLTTPHLETRITPSFLQPWADKKWGHDRVRGFAPTYLRELLEKSGLQRVDVRSLSIAAFRRRYLALSALWRLWPALARRAVVATARRDARGPDGPHGWIVASGSKGSPTH